jgi:sialate O-acetylesterase
MNAKTGVRLVAAFLLGAAPLAAEVRLASPFGSHMVLQRGMAVPVWGTAEGGETVTVEFAGQKKSATAGTDGHWRVNLDALVASADARVMTVAGSRTAQPLRLDDVLVGEVWLGSGQSNMEFTVSKKVKSFAGAANEEQEIAAANYPLIRMFTGAGTKTYEPQDHIRGEWQVCSPETVPAFSAVGYFFARDLQKEIKVPIGILALSFGASTAEAWIRRETLAADPALKPMLDRFDAAVQAFRSKPPATVAPPRSEDVSAPAQVTVPPPASPTTTTADASGTGLRTVVLPALGVVATPRRAGKKAASDPAQDQHNATVLFNGMINPVIPYAMRGVIWYQGESIVGGDAGRALYPHVQATLVQDWRSLWGEGDFPFYIVQLAGQDANSNSPVVREAQATLLTLQPNTGMAVTVDIGEAKNVHPHNKQDVGDRLTRIALANVYGRKIEYSGPMYESMSVDGAAVRLKFSHVGGGLVAKGGPLRWFVIAGADQKFVAADARIEGDGIVVSSPEIAAPVAVRYAWDNFPDGCNLYNAASLPSPSFRTDRWK